MAVLPPQAVGRWSTAEIHDTVAAIARQLAYAVPLRRSLLGRAFAYLLDRFTDLLELLHGSRDFRLVAIASVVVVVLAIAGRVLISRQVDVVGQRAGRSRGSAGERRDYWVVATELAAAGDHVGACHALYAAVVDALVRRGDVKFHSSKTSGDYARELRRRGSPVFQSFLTFARQFDRVVYGRVMVDAADYAGVLRAAESRDASSERCVTAPPAARFRGLNAVKLLSGLAAVVAAVALFTPEPAGKSEGGRSSFSTAPGGVAMAFELAQRTGWRAERRITPMDSTGVDTTVQVVIDPNSALGAHEVHRLLENVRRGGGLIFTLGADELADSLGVAKGQPARLLAGYRDPECPNGQSIRQRALLALPPEVRGLFWKPRPAGLTPLVNTDKRFGPEIAVAMGLPMGKGRVAVVSTASILANDAVGVCEWSADVAVARVLEYVRPQDRRTPVIVFDEFHHGFGLHGGSFTAITRYLTGTSSGHFLGQALIAGLVLLLALAPRPLPPTDPQHIARRSPLEHADALGHAYADVGATRNVARQLVAGVRRRAGRTIGVSAGADDAAFLDAVTVRHASLAAPVAVIRRALRESIAARELPDVGDALRTVEQHLGMPPQRAP